MSPNPSKIMAPVQMQSSPIQMQRKGQLIDYSRGKAVAGREKPGIVKGKAKDKERERVQSRTTPAVNMCKDGGVSPKTKSLQNVYRSNEQSPQSGKKAKGKSGTVSPPYNGRKSISPDGDSYAGAKFSEAPTPDRLPMPPREWLSSFSSGKKKIKSCPQFQECSMLANVSAGHSAFDDIAKDLKMMLKVES